MAKRAKKMERYTVAIYDADGDTLLSKEKRVLWTVYAFPYQTRVPVVAIRGGYVVISSDWYGATSFHGFVGDYLSKDDVAGKRKANVR